MILLATAACLVSTVLGAKAKPYVPQLIKGVKLAMGKGTRTERDYGRVSPHVTVCADKDHVALKLGTENWGRLVKLDMDEMSRLRDIIEDVMLWHEMEDD